MNRQTIFSQWRVSQPSASTTTHAVATPGVHLGLSDVGRRFGATRVLNAIDLDVAPGQFVAVVGRSGCGKSTLLRLIAGLDEPSVGVIRADGQPLADRGAATRLMFQNARLLPWKHVIDNVGLGLSGNWRDKAREALAEVGLADKADVWPAQLSGGQQQRVALARALIHEPRLLLLDEPLGALDALTRLEMQALVERLCRAHGFTVLLVTHDVAEAVQLADRVIVLENGGIDMDLAIDVERPREHNAPRLAALERRVLDRVLGRPTPPVETDNEAPSYHPPRVHPIPLRREPTIAADEQPARRRERA